MNYVCATNIFKERYFIQCQKNKRLCIPKDLEMLHYSLLTLFISLGKYVRGEMYPSNARVIVQRCICTY